MQIQDIGGVTIGADLDPGDASDCTVKSTCYYNPVRGRISALIHSLLKRWANEAMFGVHLDEGEISQLSAFLRMLEYDSDQLVVETE